MKCHALFVFYDSVIIAKLLVRGSMNKISWNRNKTVVHHLSPDVLFGIAQYMSQCFKIGRAHIKKYLEFCPFLRNSNCVTMDPSGSHQQSERCHLRDSACSLGSAEVGYIGVGEYTLLG